MHLDIYVKIHLEHLCKNAPGTFMQKCTWDIYLEMHLGYVCVEIYLGYLLHA